MKHFCMFTYEYKEPVDLKAPKKLTRFVVLNYSIKWID